MRLFFCFFLLFSLIHAQSDNNWWIFFNDKDCDQIINLSDRSIERRLRQNIMLDQHDVSLCQCYIDSLQKNDLRIRHKLKWLNAVSVSIKSDSVLNKIQKFNFVKRVRPVLKMVKNKNFNIFRKNVSHQFNSQSFQSLPYGASLNQIQMLGGDALHDEGFLGGDMIIAVFDAGFIGTDQLPVFANLWLNNQILDTYDFVDDDISVFEGSSHGTMVLSTMAGYMIDSLIGTAPEADYMLFRTEDSSSETLIEEDNWAAAAEYADSAGVDIINSSLGYTILYDDLSNSHSYSDMDGNSTIITNAADLAASRGILVVNSAGNSGNSDWHYIGAPADGDSVLAVGAVNSLGEIASFSSRGPSYDGRVKPNVCAQGVSTIVADLDSTIRVANGTSFSSPIIAGLSACLWQSDPTLTNMELLNLIESSSHIFFNPNDSLGHGIPNFHMAYLNNANLNSDDNNFIIYPNPFQDYFSIHNNQYENFSFEIVNLFGKSIFNQMSSSFNIIVHDISQIKPGFYWLRVSDTDIVYPIIKVQ